MCGCGSSGGSDQIISIDSEYRGEPVYDKDGDYLGKTPLFLKVNPHANEYLKTKIPQGFQTQRMGALPLPGLNLNRNQTGQSGPYCKLRPTRVPYFWLVHFF